MLIFLIELVKSCGSSLPSGFNGFQRLWPLWNWFEWNSYLLLAVTGLCMSAPADILFPTLQDVLAKCLTPSWLNASQQHPSTTAVLSGAICGN